MRQPSCPVNIRIYRYLIVTKDGEMCQSKEDGGKRCDYADQVANARRKARYKFRDDYDMDRKAEKEVRTWKETNAALVVAHLPEVQPFQTSANKKPIPASLTALLTQKAREAVTGLPEQDRLEHTRNLYEAQEEWVKGLTNEQESAVRQYTMYFFEGVNAHLRRSGYSDWLKANPVLYSEHAETLARVKRDIASLDIAIAKAPVPEEPRKLYRFFRVPAGVTPNEYMERYLKEGEAFKDKGSVTVGFFFC